jgi:hypothetical protein
MYRGNDSLAAMFNQKKGEETHNLRGEFVPTVVDVNLPTTYLEAPTSGGFNLQPVDTNVSQPTGLPDMQNKPGDVIETAVLQEETTTALNASSYSGGGMVLKPGTISKSQVSSLPAEKPSNNYINIAIAVVVLIALYAIYKYSSKSK